jgi:hypothetical protein
LPGTYFDAIVEASYVVAQERHDFSAIDT